MNTLEVLTLLLVVFAALSYIDNHNDRDEIRSANLALISGRQMHRINACIFLVAITKRNSTPSKVNAISLHIVHLRCQSRIFPSMEIVTTCQGIILPQSCSAFFAAISRPPQHGTSMRSTVTERISFCFRISVSFSL